MSSQQLTDVLGNMKDHSNNLVKFEEKISRFARTVMANEAEVRRYDPALYNTLLDEISQAEQLSTELQYRLYNADQVIANEKITMSHSQTNQKDLFVKLQVLGLRLGVDFTFTLDNNNDNNNNDNDNDNNNPHLNFFKGTVLGVKEQGLGISDKG